MSLTSTIFRKIVPLLAFSGIQMAAQAAQGALENPVDGVVESGIGVISGWHCTARDITITVDGVSLGLAGSGTLRNDTAAVCGHTASGFSLLYNWNNLSAGEHVVTAYADGVMLGSRTIRTVKSAGQKYARDLTRSLVVEGFPTASEGTRLEWREDKQSFVVTGSYQNIFSLDGTYDLIQGSLQDTGGGLLDSDQSNVDMTGTMTINGASFWYSVTVTINGQSATASNSGPLYDYGYYMADASGNKIIIVDRGETLITSKLYFLTGTGYTNEVEVWKKRLN